MRGVPNGKAPWPELDQRPMDCRAARHENRENDAALIGNLIIDGGGVRTLENGGRGPLDPLWSTAPTGVQTTDRPAQALLDLDPIVIGATSPVLVAANMRL
jgi:hypothetical protein